MVTPRFGSDEAALDALYHDLSAARLQPLWELRGLLTPAPRVRAVPYLEQRPAEDANPGQAPRSQAELRWGVGAGLVPAATDHLPEHSPLLVYR